MTNNEIMFILSSLKSVKCFKNLNGRVLRQNGDIEAQFFVFRKRTGLMKAVTNIYVKS